MTRQNAERLIARHDRRRRNLLGLWCLPIGIAIGVSGLVAWMIYHKEIDSFDGIAVLSAGVMGLVFGMLMVAVVPIGLCRKPLKPALRCLGYIVVPATTLITLLTGLIPFGVAGIVVILVVLGIMMMMPNAPVLWSRAKCVACGYDLSAAPTHQCPECGVTESDVQAATATRRWERCSPPVMVWLNIALLFWLVLIALIGSAL